MAWYVPSIKVRKLQSGKPCPGCGLLMHHGDMVAWSGSEGTIYLHDKCAQIILDITAEDVISLQESAEDGES